MYYGYQAVARLAISHSFPARQETATPSKPVAKKAPTYNVENITDPELKTALQGLANSLSGK